jgi:hypothetical protein
MDRPPRLLDLMREALRARHYSLRTERAYCLWVRRFTYSHHLRHPADMGEPEISAFLTHLAVTGNVSASTQNQALAAMLFLYRHVLAGDVGDLDGVIRAKHSTTVPAGAGSRCLTPSIASTQAHRPTGAGSGSSSLNT